VNRSTTQKYFKDSMLAYFEKWQPSWQLPILKLFWFAGSLVMKLFRQV
jgi:hypothetical protein